MFHLKYDNFINSIETIFKLLITTMNEGVEKTMKTLLAAWMLMYIQPDEFKTPLARQYPVQDGLMDVSFTTRKIKKYIDEIVNI